MIRHAVQATLALVALLLVNALDKAGEIPPAAVMLLGITCVLAFVYNIGGLTAGSGREMIRELGAPQIPIGDHDALDRALHNDGKITIDELAERAYQRALGAGAVRHNLNPPEPRHAFMTREQAVGHFASDDDPFGDPNVKRAPDGRWRPTPPPRPIDSATSARPAPRRAEHDCEDGHIWLLGADRCHVCGLHWNDRHGGATADG